VIDSRGEWKRATVLEVAAKATLQQALDALKRDPTHPVRAQVDDLTVELRVVAEPAIEAPAPVEGLFADEPELIDEICDEAMRARERDPLTVRPARWSRLQWRTSAHS